MSVCLYSSLTYPARRRLRRIILSVACPTIQYFPHYLINGSLFGKKDTEQKCFDTLCNFCLEHLSF